MRTVADILADLVKYGKLKNQAALARALGVKPNTLSMWKKRHLFDYGLIVNFCEDNGIPATWVLTGQVTLKQVEIKGKTVAMPTDEPGPYRLDPGVLDLMPEYGGMPKEVKKTSKKWKEEAQKSSMIRWIETFWAKALPEERSWMVVQFKKCFPDYVTWLASSKEEK